MSARIKQTESGGNLAAEILERSQQVLYKQTDRLFAGLLLFQWVAGIALAAVVSPRTWAGSASAVHPHLIAAIFLGGAITLFPIALAFTRAGKLSTRLVIGVAQMMWSGLLIHLTGGRIETHFHVFGSLAFLAFYRDWRVLVPATTVVVLDHLFRGALWPQSTFGAPVSNIWRALEHGGWVVFEDIILVLSCIRGAREMADTAERERQQLDLFSSMRAAESASEAKSAFLANMSHEIRTPMTAIVGYADMMLEPDQTLSDRHDCLQVIRRNARHLLALIGDILDLSKIEAEKMTVERIPVDPAQLTVDVVSLTRARAIEKGLTFTLTFGEAVPRKIQADPLRLKQVLMNLVSNAIKFTQSGGVRVRMSCERPPGGPDRLRFDISDTGIGMTTQQIEGLFRPFAQADESTTRKFGGTGLGLVISKRLANLMGGDILVQSMPGVGSTFSVMVDPGSLDGVEMSRNLQESMVALSTPTPVRSGVRLSGRILLAEDGVDNQRLIASHLRRAGAEVAVAENGRIAVDKATAERFDLIFMDMQMPELDGYGATSELRRRGWKGAIVALTAHAMTGDRERCIAAGCTEYLSKPVDRDVLVNMAASFMPTAAAAVKVEPAPPVVAEPAPAPPAGTLRSIYAADADMREVLGEFIAALPEQVDRLTALLREADVEELRRAVHQLKGAGGGYGFAPVTRLAAKAEAALKADLSLDEVQADVDALIELIRTIEGYDAKREHRVAA